MFRTARAPFVWGRGFAAALPPRTVGSCSSLSSYTPATSHPPPTTPAQHFSQPSPSTTGAGAAWLAPAAAFGALGGVPARRWKSTSGAGADPSGSDAGKEDAAVKGNTKENAKDTSGTKGKSRMVPRKDELER